MSTKMHEVNDNSNNISNKNNNKSEQGLIRSPNSKWSFNQYVDGLAQGIATNTSFSHGTEYTTVLC